MDAGGLVCERAVSRFRLSHGRPAGVACGVLLCVRGVVSARIRGCDLWLSGVILSVRLGVAVLLGVRARLAAVMTGGARPFVPVMPGGLAFVLRHRPDGVRCVRAGACRRVRAGCGGASDVFLPA